MLKKLFKRSAVFILIYTLITPVSFSVAWSKTRLQDEITEKLKTYVHMVGEPATAYNPMATEEITNLVSAIDDDNRPLPFKPLYIDILRITDEHLKTVAKITEGPMFDTVQVYEGLFFNLLSFRQSFFELLKEHSQSISPELELSLAIQAASFNKPLSQKEEDQVLELLLPELEAVIDSIFSKTDGEAFSSLYLTLLNEVDLSKNNRLLSLFYLRKSVSLYFQSSATFQEQMRTSLLEKMPPLLSDQTDFINWQLLGFPDQETFIYFKESAKSLPARTQSLMLELKSHHPDFFDIEFSDPLSASNWYADFLETLSYYEPAHNESVSNSETEHDDQAIGLKNDLSALYDIIGDLVDSLQISYFFLTDNVDLEDHDDVDDFERLPDHQFLQKTIEQVVFEDTTDFIKNLYLKTIFDYLTVSEMHDPISLEAQRRLTVLFDYGREHNLKLFLKKIAFVALTEKTYDPVVRLSAYNYLNAKLIDPIERSAIEKWKQEIVKNNPLSLSHTSRDSKNGFELIINGESFQPDFLPIPFAEGHHHSQSFNESDAKNNSLMCKNYL